MAEKIKLIVFKEGIGKLWRFLEFSNNLNNLSQKITDKITNRIILFERFSDIWLKIIFFTVALDGYPLVYTICFNLMTKFTIVNCWDEFLSLVI